MVMLSAVMFMSFALRYRYCHRRIQLRNFATRNWELSTLLYNRTATWSRSNQASVTLPRLEYELCRETGPIGKTMVLARAILIYRL